MRVPSFIARIATFLAIVSVQVQSTAFAFNTHDSPHTPYKSEAYGAQQEQHWPPSQAADPLPNGQPRPSDRPWGNPSGDDTAPSKTGVTRSYEWTISRGTAAPDGYTKPSILINGQFPGPLIEVNWGDTIQVTVHNKITGPEEGTTIHWHGQLQKGTPQYDGVPSLTQCPIAPGATFTYIFQAQTYGTSWYHSHFQGQLLDGLFGPLVVHGPDHVHYDHDLGPILIQDYFHTPYIELTTRIMSTNLNEIFQSTDNTLINGKMPYNCSLAAPGSDCKPNAQFSIFQVEAGKTYKLRVINSGADSYLGFSIDNHELTIISNDFTPLVPYQTTMARLSPGQRSDILFTPKAGGSVWMRAQSLGNFGFQSFSAAAQAIVLVNDASESTIPTSTAWPPRPDNGQYANDPLEKTVPFYPQHLPDPSVTYNVVINEYINSTGHLIFDMNGYPFLGDYNDPILRLAQEKNYSYPLDPKWNVVNFGTNSSVRVNIWNNNPSPHPMHLHGHGMWILSSGTGQWDGHTIVNPQNPQRRDTHNLVPFGHMVMQYNTDNPGTWAFHCHLAFHLSQGMFMTFMERPDDITSPQIPETMKQTCTAWDVWTSKNIVNQIDSGA